MSFEIAPEPFLKNSISHKPFNLPKNAAPFVVYDGCSAYVNDHMCTSRNLNGKSFKKGISSQCRVGLTVEKLVLHLPFRMVVLHCLVAEEGREALIKPKILPIGGTYQIPKPLMDDFMGDDFANPLLAFT
jgi:hypothetical protein